MIFSPLHAKYLEHTFIVRDFEFNKHGTLHFYVHYSQSIRNGIN